MKKAAFASVSTYMLSLLFQILLYGCYASGELTTGMDISNKDNINRQLSELQYPEISSSPSTGFGVNAATGVYFKKGIIGASIGIKYYLNRHSDFVNNRQTVMNMHSYNIEVFGGWFMNKKVLLLCGFKGRILKADIRLIDNNTTADNNITGDGGGVFAGVQYFLSKRKFNMYSDPYVKLTIGYDFIDRENENNAFSMKKLNGISINAGFGFYFSTISFF